MQTVTLTASARFGFGGKQYIARITGRDSKFTFAREFVGTKSGKRRESAEYMTDNPGLYITCDIDRKGNKDETYWVVEQTAEGLDGSTCTKEQAMKLAKLLDEGKSFEAALAIIWPSAPVTDDTPRPSDAALAAAVALLKELGANADEIKGAHSCIAFLLVETAETALAGYRVSQTTVV